MTVTAILYNDKVIIDHDTEPATDVETLIEDYECILLDGARPECTRIEIKWRGKVIWDMQKETDGVMSGMCEPGWSEFNTIHS